MSAPMWSLGRLRSPAFETPDGKLWLCYRSTSNYRVGSFDGTSFRLVSKIKNFRAVGRGPDGRVWVSAGGRLWRYQDGGWQNHPLPKQRAFKTWPAGAGGGNTMTITSLCVTSDGTVCLGTDEGIVYWKDEKWRTLQFAKGSPEATPEPLTEAEQGFQQLLAGVVPPGLLEASHKMYVEGEGRQLVDATDDQLAEEIAKRTGHLFPQVVSYYRLRSRDEARAERCLKQAIGLRVKERGDFSSMMYVPFGEPRARILLEIAKTGSVEDRQEAIDGLAFFADPRIARQLIKLLDEPKMPVTATYLRVVGAAMMASDPKGVELLIDAATRDAYKSAEEAREAVRLRRKCREELHRVTGAYDDAPSDWSREQWNAWWAKHRATWKPSGRMAGAAQMAAATRTSHKVWKDTAKRLEARRKTE